MTDNDEEHNGSDSEGCELLSSDEESSDLDGFVVDDPDTSDDEEKEEELTELPDGPDGLDVSLIVTGTRVRRVPTRYEDNIDWESIYGDEDSDSDEDSDTDVKSDDDTAEASENEVSENEPSDAEATTLEDNVAKEESNDSDDDEDSADECTDTLKRHLTDDEEVVFNKKMKCS